MNNKNTPEGMAMAISKKPLRKFKATIFKTLSRKTYTFTARPKVDTGAIISLGHILKYSESCTKVNRRPLSLL